MSLWPLWLQFRSLILHLYQTPGEKQAENQVSTHVITTHLVCLSLCLTLIRNKQDKRPQQASMSHYMAAVHMSISSCQCSSTVVFFKGLSMQLGFKELHIRDPLRIRAVPLNPTVLMCHSGTLLCFDSCIVAMSYGSNQACPISTWPQSQQEAGITNVLLHMQLPLWVSWRCTEPSMH